MTGARARLRAGWSWLGARDPGYGALRRAGRAAIVMPACFALAMEVIGNPALATFAAFGAIATLLLVDFRGELRDRLTSQAALVVVGAALICLGSLAATDDVAAVAGMVVVGIAVIFAGVVSSALASATTPLLLMYILPVSLPGGAAAIPDRLLGWGLAGGASMVAIALLWPAGAADPLRAASAAVCRALAARLHGDAGGGSRDALAAMDRVFLAAPARPTGLTTAARATVRLVDELRWLARVLELTPGAESVPAVAGGGAGGSAVLAVRAAAAAVLEQSATVLEHPAGPTEPLARARDALEAITRALPARVRVGRAPARDGRGAAAAGGAAEADADVRAVVSALDPAFRAQEASFMTLEIAGNAQVFAAASRRSWWERAIGRQPAGFGGRLMSIRERAGAHLSVRSTALHNALRGGAGLGIAVLVARVSGVEHAFWVSFGALSILRSNALSTGQTFARAIAGTAVGFVIGAAIVLGIGTDTTLLWILLPVVVLFAGIAPAAISFVAGQASFTIVLFILFNLLAPAGWRIGLVRIEDVALGGGSSLLVGLLFWPRGAGAALGRALGESYAAAGAYLTRAVDVAVVCCAPGMPGLPGPRPAPAGPGGSGPTAGAGAGAAAEAQAAAAASRRLDDTFRTYLAEGGPKRLPLSEATTLVNGTAVLRLAGDAISDLWRGESEPTQARIGAARELLGRARATERWYDGLRGALLGDGELPAPEPRHPGADSRLVATIDHDLRSDDPVATEAAVRVVWTGDHLDALRRLEPLLADAVRAATGEGALGSARCMLPAALRARLP